MAAEAPPLPAKGPQGPTQMALASMPAPGRPSTAPAKAGPNWGATIEADKAGFTQVGVASFYSATGPTASGMKVAPEVMTAAHRSLPFGSKVKVQHIKTGREVEVVVTDRGPFLKGRILDISHRAAQALGIVGQGVARVRLTLVE